MKIFVNFDSDNKDIRSIAVENGIIRRFNINPELYSNCETINLNRCFLSPGFIDIHTHFLHSALELDGTDLKKVENIDDIIAIMRTEGKNKGYGYDDGLWKIKPNRYALDVISKTEPIFIVRADRHSIIVNSYALGLLKIPENLKNKYTENGIFQDKSLIWINKKIFETYTESDRQRAFETAEKLAFKNGITTVHALEGGDGWGMEDPEFMLKKEKEGASESILGIILYPQTVNINWVKERGLKRIGGCILLDGSIGGSTAALSEPYCDDPSNNGKLYFSDKALFSLVKRAHLAELQMSFHAIGDRAVEQISRIYNEILTKYPNENSRHRIEHCELLSQKSLNLIYKNKIYLSVQPIFEYLWGDELYKVRLGNRKTNVYKTMLEKGIVLGGGSDFNVTDMNPILGIHAAVNRLDSDQKLTKKEAFDLFTANAAKFSFGENKIGTLKEGSYADFAVLSSNPYKCPDEKIKNLTIQATYKKGILKYSNY